MLQPLHMSGFAARRVSKKRERLDLHNDAGLNSCVALKAKNYCKQDFQKRVKNFSAFNHHSDNQAKPEYGTMIFIRKKC